MSCPVVRAIGLIGGAFAESDGLFCITGGVEHSISEASYLASKVAIKAASRELAGLPPRTPYAGRKFDDVVHSVLRKLKYKRIVKKCALDLQLQIIKFEKALASWVEKQLVNSSANGKQLVNSSAFSNGKQLEGLTLPKNTVSGFGLTLPTFVLIEPDLKPNTMYAIAVAACNYINLLSVNGQTPTHVEPPSRPVISLEGPDVGESEYVESMIAVYKTVESIEEYNSICVNKVIECTKNLAELINRMKLDSR